MNKNKQILIIGGGRRGLATIEILYEDDAYDIIAVIDKNSNASGIKLAQRLGIKTDSDWVKYIADTELPDAVLNLTDDYKLQKTLMGKVKGKKIEIMGDFTSQLLSSILMERQIQVELHRVSQRITSNIGLDELMVLILSSCVKSVSAEGGIIILFDETTHEWEIKSNWGIQDDIEGILLDKASEKLPGWPEKDEIISLESMSETVRSTLCAPLRSRDNITGAIIVTKNKPAKEFSNSSRRLLATFANHSAVAIENTLLYKKTQLLSVTDGLTGLYNHRYFQERMQIELSRAQRYDLNFSLIMIDVDNFKDINDTYGHLIGDELLIKVSLHLKKTVRESDAVARYGGDEFVILLPETAKKDAMVVGERIRVDLIERKIGGNIGVHVSAGVSAYPDDGVYSQDIIKKADDALYRAKQEGRNRTYAA